MKSKIYTPLPKYMQKKAQRVTNMINEWNKADMTSNDLEVAKDLLSDFYDNIGKSVKDNQLASDRIRLSKSEKEEYNKILDYILHNDDVDISKRMLKNQMIRDTWNEQNKEVYEKVKAQYDQVYDEQSFIKFVDRMNISKSNSFLRYVFSSDQMAHLYSGAYNARMTEAEVNRKIAEQYDLMEKNEAHLFKNNEAEARDILYERVIGIIEEKEIEYKQLHPKAKNLRLRKRKK